MELNAAALSFYWIQTENNPEKEKSLEDVAYRLIYLFTQLYNSPAQPAIYENSKKNPFFCIYTNSPIPRR